MDVIKGIVALIQSIHTNFDDDVVAVCGKILEWLDEHSIMPI